MYFLAIASIFNRAESLKVGAAPTQPVITTNEALAAFVDSNPDATRLEIDNVFSDIHITNYSPIAKLCKLRWLVLDRNRNFTDLSLLNCMKDLEFLSVEGTGVKDIGPISHLGRLVGVDLSKTLVTNVDTLSDMKALVQIILDNCHVTSVNLKGMPALRSLFLGESTLRSLSLVDLPELQIVRADDTPLSTLAELEGLPKLESIALSSTLLTDVTLLGNIPSFDRIDLSNTLVSDISALAALPNLKSLDIDNTRVVDFPPELADRGLLDNYSRFTLITLEGETRHACGLNASTVSSWWTRFFDVENKLPQAERLFPDGYLRLSILITGTSMLASLNGMTVYVHATRRFN